MSFLPLELAKIATRQLSPSLPLGKRNDSRSPVHQRRVQKTADGLHWYIAGKTGTGKTKLVKEIINKKIRFNPHLNIYYLDTKKQGDFSSRDGTMIVSDNAPDAFTTTGNRMVWQPIEDRKSVYDTFFRRILLAKLPSIVFIDECVNVKFGDSIPRELSILALQGRAAGIHILAGTQEVAKSPRQLRSQATFIVSFLLTDEYDKNAMIRALELDDRKLGLKNHQFWVRDTSTGDPAKKYDTYQEFMPLVH